ncbi:hypothetical protein HQ563_08890 [bacterium]|nr:hypothetical protein [bacterium]
MKRKKRQTRRGDGAISEPTATISENSGLRYAFEMITKTAMMAATQSHPTANPMTERRVGIRISRSLFGKRLRGGGTTAFFGREQGEGISSPGAMGVRVRA